MKTGPSVPGVTDRPGEDSGEGAPVPGAPVWRTRSDTHFISRTSSKCFLRSARRLVRCVSFSARDCWVDDSFAFMDSSSCFTFSMAINSSSTWGDKGKRGRELLGQPRSEAWTVGDTGTCPPWWTCWKHNSRSLPPIPPLAPPRSDGISSDVTQQTIQTPRSTRE